jgi:phosphoglycolate phosphatase
MSRPARLLVFDLDGTLVDSLADIASAANTTLRRIAPGVAPLTREEVRAFVGEGARQLVERCLAARGLPHSPDDVLPLYLETYRAGLLVETRLYPGVREALEELGGRTLAVLTNKPGDLSRAILEGLGVAGFFARIWGGGDVVAKKPDPAGLLALIAELQARPNEAVLVGDSPVDVRTARAAGVTSVGATYGFDPEGLVGEPPDVRIDDLRRMGEVLASLTRERQETS